MRTVELAFWIVHGAGGDRAAHVLQRKSKAGQLRHVRLQPHRAGLATFHRDRADPGNLRQLLHQCGRRIVVDLVQRQRIRGQRQDQHRHIGRIDLMIGRRPGQQGDRNPAEGCIDRRLHILRSGIDAARQVEGQGDLAGAVGAGGTHAGQSGDLAEIMFQRRGDRRFHDIRRGAGIRGNHLDRGKVHVRQSSDRQQPIAEQPQHNQRNGQQRRGDRPQDERT